MLCFMYAVTYILGMNSARIRRAIKSSYRIARAAIADARSGVRFGDTIGYHAALETVAYHRGLNRDRRQALRSGKLV